MPTKEEAASAEREQTDESLRAEREKVDLALAESLESFEEVADSVITLARVRADEVLAAARTKADRLAPHAAVNGKPLVQARAHEDRLLQQERDTADEVLRDERADQVAVLGTERDETDKDLVLERERADDALATRDEFLAVVSHDLRNLLSTVMGFAQLITREAEHEKYNVKVVRDAQRIQRAGTRMNRLIGDLVDIASIHSGRLAVTPYAQAAAPVVQEAVDTFQAQATSRSIALVAELVSPLATAVFDPARIFQVLGNLLSNALKFTPPKGRVVVRVEQVESELRFSVRDTGPGIPADKLEAIFERYLQVHPGDRRGVGLGLYISRWIVQSHGGRIWAQSTQGEGSTVSFTLPTSEVQSSAAARSSIR